MQLKKLEQNCKQIETLITQIKGSNNANAAAQQRAQLSNLRQAIHDSIQKIKSNQLKDETSIKGIIVRLSDMANAQVNDLRKLIAEQERLRVLQEQLDQERRKR